MAAVDEGCDVGRTLLGHLELPQLPSLWHGLRHLHQHARLGLLLLLLLLLLCRACYSCQDALHVWQAGGLSAREARKVHGNMICTSPKCICKAPAGYMQHCR